jgi:hypothetical protein
MSNKENQRDHTAITESYSLYKKELEGISETFALHSSRFLRYCQAEKLLELSIDEAAYSNLIVIDHIVRDKIRKSDVDEKSYLQKFRWYRTYVEPRMDQLLIIQHANKKAINDLGLEIGQGRADKIGEAIHNIFALASYQGHHSNKKYTLSKTEMESWGKAWKNKIPPRPGNPNPAP